MIPLEKIMVLNKVPLFSALHSDDLYAISTIAQEEAHEQGHILFHQGDIGDSLFIIVTGAVRILKDNQHTLATLHENDFLGDLALFGSETRTATAKCEGSCLFLVISRDDIEQLAHEYPAILFGFIKVLNQRLREMIAQQ